MAVGTIPGTEISCRRRSPHHPFRGKPLVNRFPRRILSHTRLGRGTVFKLDNTGAGLEDMQNSLQRVTARSADIGELKKNHHLLAEKLHDLGAQAESIEGRLATLLAPRRERFRQDPIQLRQVKGVPWPHLMDPDIGSVLEDGFLLHASERY